MILFAVFTLLVAEAGFIYLGTERTLEKERQKQSKQNAVSFSKVGLTPHLTQNVRIIQNTRRARSLVEYKNSLFAATDGGLLQMSETGETVRHFTVLDGLPESDLTVLEVFGGKLFIGTGSAGLLEFDGEKFARFRFDDHETKSITALFADSGRLLIGTLAGGLLEFNGVEFAEIRALDRRLGPVTVIARSHSTLLVGTFDAGLWIRQNQIWRQFTTADGLFSNRVVGAAPNGPELFVATDLGLSQISLAEALSNDRETAFRKVFALSALSSLAAGEAGLYLTRDNGEIFTFSPAREGTAESGLKKFNWPAPAGLRAARLFRAGGAGWLLTSRGIWKSHRLDSDETLAFARFSKTEPADEIADNQVSALAVDSADRLWIGTFRNGIDVFSAAGKKLRHIETETVREINSLAPSADRTGLFAATSAGALRFGPDFAFAADGGPLPSRAVNQIAELETGRIPVSAISTAKGLVLGDGRRQRLFSIVNGLPANTVTAALFARNSLFVGTPGGLAQIDDNRVTRVFKTSNSELGHNWVTALARAGDRIFIGTYGGGVFELLPAGELRGFAAETGRLFVNPNALFADGERLLAGTLDGLWELDLTTQKWSRIKAVLPSANVLSIAGRPGAVYIGTTGGIARLDKNFWTEN